MRQVLSIELLSTRKIGCCTSGKMKVENEYGIGGLKKGKNRQRTERSGWSGFDICFIFVTVCIASSFTSNLQWTHTYTCTHTHSHIDTPCAELYEETESMHRSLLSHQLWARRSCRFYICRCCCWCWCYYYCWCCCICNRFGIVVSQTFVLV